MSKYNKQVIISSLARSGSTFIYQILTMIFKHVEGSHHYRSNTDILVYRNFFDSTVSNYRVRLDKEKVFIDNKKDLYKAIDIHVPYIHELFRYQSELGKLLLLSYENDIYLSDCKNNYDVIFRKIEDYFKVKIDNKDEIKAHTNFSANLKRSQLYDTFGKFDKETMIHGKSVTKDDGEVGGWRNSISENLHEFYLNSEINYLSNKWERMINNHVKI